LEFSFLKTEILWKGRKLLEEYSRGGLGGGKKRVRCRDKGPNQNLFEKKGPGGVKIRQGGVWSAETQEKTRETVISYEGFAKRTEEHGGHNKRREDPLPKPLPRGETENIRKKKETETAIFTSDLISGLKKRSTGDEPRPRT